MQNSYTPFQPARYTPLNVSTPPLNLDYIPSSRCIFPIQNCRPLQFWKQTAPDYTPYFDTDHSPYETVKICNTPTHPPSPTQQTNF